jgi:hypothetical protein
MQSTMLGSKPSFDPYGRVYYIGIDVASDRSHPGVALPMEFRTTWPSSKLDSVMYLNPALTCWILPSHLSPFMFTNTLLPLMKTTAQLPNSDVRIVNVRVGFKNVRCIFTNILTDNFCCRSALWYIRGSTNQNMTR